MADSEPLSKNELKRRQKAEKKAAEKKEKEAKKAEEAAAKREPKKVRKLLKKISAQMNTSSFAVLLLRN